MDRVVAFQVVLVVKNLPTNAGDIRDMGSIPGWGWSPGEGIQYSCLGKAHGQRSLVDYSPKGQEELDTTGHNNIPKIVQKNLAFQLKKN